MHFLGTKHPELRLCVKKFHSEATLDANVVILLHKLNYFIYETIITDSSRKIEICM